MDPTVHLSKAWLLTFCSEPNKTQCKTKQSFFSEIQIRVCDWVTCPFFPTLCGCVKWIISRTECMVHLHVYAAQLYAAVCWCFHGLDTRVECLVLKFVGQFSWPSVFVCVSLQMLHCVTATQGLTCSSTCLHISCVYLLANISLSKMCLHQQVCW